MNRSPATSDLHTSRFARFSTSLVRGLGLVLLFVSITDVSFAQNQALGRQAVPGEFIVKYKSSVTTNVRSQRSKLSAKSNMRKAYPEMGMYHISLKADAAASATQAQTLADIKSDPDVEFVEPNYIWYKHEEVPPADALGSVSLSSYSYSDIIGNRDAAADNGFYQNNLSSDVEQSWTLESTVGQKGKVIVAIVDTGLDSGHTLFKSVSQGGAGALWVNVAEAKGLPGVDDDQNGFVDDINGWNFHSNTANYFDDEGHGTHVAGIVVGAGQNIFARPLAESKIQVMPLKFLGADGSGTTSSAINAIYYAVHKGAQVINNSWGGPTYSRALHEAMTYAYVNAVLVVSAAGNYRSDNDSVAMYPANYDVPSNISIASASYYDVMSGFSNYGRTSVHVASPGEYILSSAPGDRYAFMSGTSMAAPFVAGVAALAWRENSSLTGYQVKQLVMTSADVLSPFSSYVVTNGRVNAHRLISSAKSSYGNSVSAYQPDYKAQYRSPASDSISSSGSVGGCGLVKSVIDNGPGHGSSAPAAGMFGGILILPLIAWFALRRRESKDGRSHERFQLNSEIRVKVGDKEVIGSMTSISLGGVSFNVDQALEKGGIVTMQISSPDGHELIEVQGQVVWNANDQKYGVKFANARQGTLAMIQQWVSTFGRAGSN